MDKAILLKKINNYDPKYVFSHRKQLMEKGCSKEDILCKIFGCEGFDHKNKLYMQFVVTSKKYLGSFLMYEADKYDFNGTKPFTLEKLVEYGADVTILKQWISVYLRNRLLHESEFRKRLSLAGIIFSDEEIGEIRDGFYDIPIQPPYTY